MQKKLICLLTLSFFGSGFYIDTSTGQDTMAIDLKHEPYDKDFFVDQDFYYTTLAMSDLEEYPNMNSYVKEKYKGIPIHDSIHFSYVAKDLFFMYDLNKVGDFSDEDFGEMITRQKIDTLGFSKVKLKPALIVVTGFKDNKEFIIADANRNRDFSDDYKYEYDITLRDNPYSAISSLDAKTPTQYTYETYAAGKLIPVSRRFILFPDRNNPYSLHGQDKYKYREYYSILKFRDYWSGEVKISNKRYEIAYHGYSHKYGALYIVPKGTKYVRNSEAYEKKFKFNYYGDARYNDTLVIGDEKYKVDSINPSITKLYLRKVGAREKFGSREGQYITDFRLPDLQGRETSFANTIKKRKYTLLDFWGTWCQPCLELTPKLKALQEKHRSKLNILGIAVDKDPQSVITYTSKHKIQWEQRFISQQRSWKNSVLKQLKIGSFPTLFLVDSNGKIIIAGDGNAVEEISKFLNDE